MTYLILLMIILMYSLFFNISESMKGLLCLIGLSISVSLYSYVVFSSFWSSGVLLLVSTTGIFVVFSFIVSLQMNPKIHLWNFYKICNVLLLVLMNLSLFTEVDVQNLFFNGFLNQSMEGSLILITCLFYSVLAFIWMTNSKGGGFRKKF